MLKRGELLSRGRRRPRHLYAVIIDITGTDGTYLRLSLARAALRHRDDPCVLVAEPAAAMLRLLCEVIPETFGASAPVVVVSPDEVRVPSELERAVATAQAKVVARELRDILDAAFHGKLAELLVYAVGHACNDIGPDALAASQGVSRSTLQTALKTAGLPAPHVIAEWARTLLAARWSAGEFRSLTRTAFVLRLGSREVLSDQVTRRLGCPLSRLKRPDSFSWALAMYRHLIDARTVGPDLELLPSAQERSGHRAS